MNYQQSIRDSMTKLAADPLSRFCGYNVIRPNSAGGSLADVPDAQLVEMPVAENLVVSAAIGMAIEGFKPVVWIERMDFLLNALDAIVNHLDKLPHISDGQYAPKVIIRTCIGSSKRPLFTGPTHCSDYTDAIRKMVSFPVFAPTSAQEVAAAFEAAAAMETPCMVAEAKDCYE